MGARLKAFVNISLLMFLLTGSLLPVFGGALPTSKSARKACGCGNRACCLTPASPQAQPEHEASVPVNPDTGKVVPVLCGMVLLIAPVAESSISEARLQAAAAFPQPPYLRGCLLLI